MATPTAKITDPSTSTEKKVLRTLRNAVQHGDCVVLIYRKKDDTLVGTRFVKPFAIEDPASDDKDFLIRTKQVFPVEGYRNFTLGRILDVQRVLPIADI